MKYISNLFKGRINRRNFFIGHLVLIGVFLACYWGLFPLSSILPKAYNSSVILIFFFTFSCLLYVFYISLIIRRYHDFGWSAWVYLLGFIPVVNLYLHLCQFFKEGQEIDNKYGDKPSQKIKFPADILNLSN